MDAYNLLLEDLRKNGIPKIQPSLKMSNSQDPSMDQFGKEEYQKDTVQGGPGDIFEYSSYFFQQIQDNKKKVEK